MQGKEKRETRTAGQPEVIATGIRIPVTAAGSPTPTPLRPPRRTVPKGTQRRGFTCKGLKSPPHHQLPLRKGEWRGAVEQVTHGKHEDTPQSGAYISPPKGDDLVCQQPGLYPQNGEWHQVPVPPP